jgi:hypothetical protein
MNAKSILSDEKSLDAPLRFHNFMVVLTRSRGRQGPGVDRLRMMIGVLTVTTWVAGCATAWVRPGAESVDLNRESIECQFEASKLTTSAGIEGVAADEKRAELETLCMRAKGWSRL